MDEKTAEYLLKHQVGGASELLDFLVFNDFFFWRECGALQLGVGPVFVFFENLR